MNAFIYTDPYQEALGKEIKAQYPSIKIFHNEGDLETFDETKLPIVLILVSQPSDALKEKIYGYPWSFYLIHKGIRFDRENMYHFDSIENFSHQLSSGTEAFKRRLMTLYEGQDSWQSVAPHKEKRLKVPLLKGIYTVSGDSSLMNQLVVAYAANQKQQKVLAIDGNLIRPSFDRLFDVASLFTKVDSQLKGIDNTGFNILYDAVNKNIPLEGLLKDITMKHRMGFDYVLGNYNIFNYEHYQLETLSNVLKILKKYYDVIFINVDTYISDTFSLLCYHESEKIIFASRDLLEEVRYVKQILEVLSLRQMLSKEKFIVAIQKSKFSIESLNTMFKNVFGKQFTTRFSPNKSDRKAIHRLFRAMGG